MATYKYGYKVLGPNRKAKYGIGSWPEVGQWTSIVDNPIMCSSGWHLIPDRRSIPHWFSSTIGDEIYIVEYRENDLVEIGHDKIVVKRARLVEKIEMPHPKIDPKKHIKLFERIDKEKVSKSRSHRLKHAYKAVVSAMNGEPIDLCELARLDNELWKYIRGLENKYWYSIYMSSGDRKISDRRDLAIRVSDILSEIMRNTNPQLDFIPDLPPDRKVDDQSFDLVVSVDAENLEEALATARYYFDNARPLK